MGSHGKLWNSDDSVTSLEETPHGDRNPGRVETRVDLRRRWLLFPLWLCQGLAGLALPHSFASALSPEESCFLSSPCGWVTGPLVNEGQWGMVVVRTMMVAVVMMMTMTAQYLE